MCSCVCVCGEGGGIVFKVTIILIACFACTNLAIYAQTGTGSTISNVLLMYIHCN